MEAEMTVYRRTWGHHWPPRRVDPFVLSEADKEDPAPREPDNGTEERIGFIVAAACLLTVFAAACAAIWWPA
jgi:hypothetical protein